ncbi:MAG: PilZ domain-containing protein [Gammaproteobacteria bacterium]
MEIDEPDTLGDGGAWGQRRNNLRHEVSIPARIVDSRGRSMNCVIQDVSSTGASLAVQFREPVPGRPSLQKDSEATLVFHPEPEDAPDDTVEIPVRVVWRAPVAAGLEFAGLTDAALTDLKQLVDQAVRDRLLEAEAVRRDLTPLQREILEACLNQLRVLLPNLLWQLRSELPKRLHAEARNLRGDKLQSLERALGKFEKEMMTISDELEEQFLRGFLEAAELDRTLSMTTELARMTWQSGPPGQPASGISKALLQNYEARIGSIGHAMEERLKGFYFELSVRLANVLGHKLSAELNPLEPMTAARILWYTVANRCAERETLKELQEVILHNLVPAFEGIYQGLDRALDEHRVKRFSDLI